MVIVSMLYSNYTHTPWVWVQGEGSNNRSVK